MMINDISCVLATSTPLTIHSPLHSSAVSQLYNINSYK